MKLIDRLDGPGDELGPEARLEERLVLDREVVERLLLVAEDLDQAVAGVHLLDVAVERPGLLPLRLELGLRALGDEDGRGDRGGHDEQRDERQQRADQQHHPEHADDREDGGQELGQALLEGGRDVVDVVGDPAQRVASGVSVEIAQRQPAELGVDALAQLVDGPLGDPGHDVGRRPGEDRAEDVDDRQQGEDPGERREVDPDAGHDGHPRDQVGLLVQAGGAHGGLGLGLRRPGRELRPELLADDAVEQDVGGGAEDPRPGDAEGHADDRQEHDQDDPGPLGAELAQEPRERAPEVARLGRSAHPGPHAHHPWGSARASAARPPHHATSSSDSCE